MMQTTKTAPMTIRAKFAGRCGCGCGASIVVGQTVVWSPGQKARLQGCATVVASTTARAAPRYRMGSGAGSAAPVAGYSSYCTDRPGCRCYDCAS